MSRFVLLAAGFVAMPIVLASSLVLPGLLGRAEGCAGAPQVYWTSLSGADDPAAPVDAPFVLVGTAVGGGPAGPYFKLTDGVGSYSGTKSLVEANDDGDVTTYAILFRPDKLLKADTTYQVSWLKNQGGSPPDQATITTTSAPASKAPAPQLAAEFKRVHALRGKLASCEPAMPCDALNVFYDTEVIAPAMAVTWSYPPTTTSVYLVTGVVAVPGKGEVLYPTLGSVQTGPSGGTATKVVAFAEELPEYCVRVSTRDLRDLSTALSPPICVSATGEPGESPETTPLLDAQLMQCATPPAGMFDEWCKVHLGRPGCPPVEADASAGAGGSAGAGAGAGTGGAVRSGDSSSCSCGSARRRQSQRWQWVYVCAAAVLQLRRRNRPRRPLTAQSDPS